MSTIHFEARETGRPSVKGGLSFAIVHAANWSRELGRPKAWIPITEADAEEGLAKLAERYRAGELKAPEPVKADGVKRALAPLEAGMAFMRAMNPNHIVPYVFANWPRPAPITLSRRDLAPDMPPRLIDVGAGLIVEFPPGGNVNRMTLLEKLRLNDAKGERRLTREEAAAIGYKAEEIAAAGDFDKPKPPKFKGKPLATVRLGNADLIRLIGARALNQNSRMTEDTAYECRILKTAAGVRIDVLRPAPSAVSP